MVEAPLQQTLAPMGQSGQVNGRGEGGRKGGKAKNESQGESTEVIVARNRYSKSNSKTGQSKRPRGIGDGP